MSDIICVTNRKLAAENFLIRLEKIAAAKPWAIILREKDLSEGEYKTLAEKALKICESYGTPLILHTYADVAIALGQNAIHLPFEGLKQLNDEKKRQFSLIGASCHSVEDALYAEALGATYITAGHIFETDCKKGLAGRGLDFLAEVCKSVSIPVYAIGGISADNFDAVKKSGAVGACIMSGLMKCPDVNTFLKELESEIQ